MAYSHITVFGGSGFLGRQIVKRLAADGARVRVAVRHPERASLLERGDRAGQITAVYADVWEAASVGAAMEGAQSSGSASPTIGPKDAERRQSRSRVVQE